jgi:hypothetical protein
MMHINFIALLFALLITLVAYFFLAVVVGAVGIGGMGERAEFRGLPALLFSCTSSLH